MDTVEKITSLLNQMCVKLFSNSSNYVVNIELLFASGMAGETVKKIASEALGKPVALGGTQSVNHNQVLNEIAASFDYNESGTAVHPNLEFIGSPKFLSLRQEILNHLEILFSSSEQTIQFWLKEGHPFYPVFWDYAFVIEDKSDAYVLIGSASD